MLARPRGICQVYRLTGAWNMSKIPEYIEKNLEWLIDHEHENPDFGKRIVEISDRYGI